MLSSRLIKNILNACLAMAVLLLVVFVTPSVIGIFIDKEAAREAKTFCDSFAIGISEENIKERVAEKSLKLEKWSSGGYGERYIVWFPGFLLNIFGCNVIIAKGVVTEKYFQAETW